MKSMKARSGLLMGAVLLWCTAITLTCLVFAGILSAPKGWGLAVNLNLAMAVTLTVVWAQFRIRRIIVDVFKLGLDVSNRHDHK